MDGAVQETVHCHYLERPTDDQLRQLVGLYRAQGWWQDGDDAKAQLLSRLIAGSHCFVIATEGEQVIGMGRAISDGISDAYIQDLTVRQDRRRRGIAGRILRLLVERLHSDGLFWIALISEPGSADLYRRFGFSAMAGATPMLMMKER